LVLVSGIDIWHYGKRPGANDLEKSLKEEKNKNVSTLQPHLSL